MIDKKKIISSILEQLQEELKIVTESANSAREAASQSDDKAEDHHDKHDLESSYLADAQASRATEIERLISVYQFLYLPEYKDGDQIGPGALVKLEMNGHPSFYFLVPQGGGLTLQVEGKPIRVITPMAPLGEALLGRSTGEEVEIESTSGASRMYRILGVS